MASPNLPTGIDTTYADDPADESVAAHQQHHDTIHAMLNDFDEAAAPSLGDRLEWDGSVWTAVSPVSAGQVQNVFVASNDAPAAVQSSADYVCDGVSDQVQINQALLDAAPLVSRNGDIPAGSEQRGRVVLSGGEFAIAAPIEMYTATDLFGQGMGTVLRAGSGIGSTGAIIEHYGSDLNTHLTRISGMYLHGNGASGAGHGIHFVGTPGQTTQPSAYPTSSPDPDIWIDHLYLGEFSGGTRHGIWMQDDMRGSMLSDIQGNASGNVIYFDGSPDSFLSNIHVHGGNYGFYLDGANIRAVNCKAYYCTTGFYLPNGRNQLSSCEAQDSVTGFNFAGPDHAASAITADVCQNDGIIVGASYTTITGCHVLFRTGGRYASSLRGITFGASAANCVVTGSVKAVTTPVSGTYNQSFNFVRISTASSLVSAG